MRVLSLSILLGVPACASAPPRPVTPVEEKAPEPVAVAPTPPPPKEIPKHSTGVIERAELVKVLDAAPPRFLQHVDSEANMVGGRFRGWRLASFFPGDPRFASLDLEVGDVVLSVNGKSIESPDQLMVVWDGLRHDKTLTVAIERDGQPRQLRFDIRD